MIIPQGGEFFKKFRALILHKLFGRALGKFNKMIVSASLRIFQKSALFNKLPNPKKAQEKAGSCKL